MQAEKGALDLSAWDFEKQGVVRLDGNWEFYWKKLYTPADFKDTQPPLSQYMYVRGYWNKGDSNPQKYTATGYATYRLKVKLPPGKNRLGLKLLDMGTSYKLWVNDDFVASNGVVSAHPDSMVPQNIPTAVMLDTLQGEMQLVVQVANDIYSKAGIWESITLGTAHQISRVNYQSNIYVAFAVGTLIILSIFYLLLYLYRRKEKDTIIFSILCVAFLIRSLVTGERTLYQLFPDFSLYIGYKLEYISLIFMITPAVYFIYYLFKEDFPKKTLRWVSGATLIMTAIILITPPKFFTQYVFLLQLYSLICDLYIIVLIKALRKRRQYSTLAFIAFFTIYLGSVNDILHSMQVINTTLVSPYAFFMFLMMQGFILSKKTNSAFNQAEDLSENLEKIVVQRTSELEEEKKKADTLLLNILPHEVANELKEHGKAKAKFYGNVTVLFTDIVNFTRISASVSPEELVYRLDSYFRHFDKIIEKHGLEKIKTIGDAYMAVCGLPHEDPDHARKTVMAAREINTFINRVDIALKGRKVDLGLPEDSVLKVRTGVHTGPVVAGIVGHTKFAYDIWGDTVNIAARMEQRSEPGKINISAATYELVKNDFNCTYRGELEAKNKGKLGMYFVEGIYNNAAVLDPVAYS